jgi:malonyl CoA-acyl carrier protein transacylase
MVLFGHRAAVYLQGYNGYFDLDEIAPLPAG